MSERSSSLKQTTLAGDAAAIPALKTLVELGGLKEHAFRISYSTGVPVSKTLVEGSSIVEHVLHVSNNTGVPSAQALIKGCDSLKHATHISEDACLAPFFALGRHHHFQNGN